MNILLRFWCSRFYRFIFSKRGQTLYLWFPPHMMDYDVSLHDLEVLFVAIRMSPRSSKSESGWKTCCVSGLEILSVYPWGKFHTFPCVVTLLHLWFLIFPTKLVSSHLVFLCICYACSAVSVSLQNRNIGPDYLSQGRIFRGAGFSAKELVCEPLEKPEYWAGPFGSGPDIPVPWNFG